MKRAFTLIELLVVIAIIAILAAILFPVFAQAKLAAKKTSDLSNLKQSAIATILYATDGDDRFPMVGYFEVQGDWSTHHLWTKDIQPYEKSLAVLHDPVEPDNLWYNAWSKPNPAIQYRYPTYGFNADYLNPAGDANCNDYMDNGWYWGPPISTTQPAQPSATVLFSATRLNMYNSTEYADSPALATDPTVCDVWGDGWGGNPGRTGTATTYTGHNSPRYMGGMNVAFTDTNARYMKAGRLAAGTNWNPKVTTDPSLVLITDRSQYLWDTQ